MRKLRWFAPAAILVVLLGPPLAVATAIMAFAGSASTEWTPTQLALDDIPPGYLAIYQTTPATWCPGLPWPVLAAIGKVETDHGRSTLPGVNTGSNSAGAAGPMQIGITGRAGNTWGGTPTRAVPPEMPYGVDGNHDSTASVYDPADAIPAAATYLCANGAPEDLEQAIYAYNHSTEYVRQVLDQANAYGTPSPGLGAAIGGIICPVPPPVHFVDTWGAPRSGGRTHEGQDLFAAYGHPLVALTNGTITETATGTGLGGTILWLETDAGPAWYYAHLSGFAPSITDGTPVLQGQMIGFVGNTGNAVDTPPHLHIQYRPTGRHGPDINPYPILSAACTGHLDPLP